MTLFRFHSFGRRSSTVTGMLAATALVLVSSLLTPHSSLFSAEQSEGQPDIRRVLLKPEQLPAELERVRRGALRQMPLAEFDGLLARVADAAAALRDPPRLLQSSYRATLNGESLSGSATWSILQRRPGAGVLLLDPLNLAVRSATWDDDSPALLGDLDARSQNSALGLLVGRPGEQRLSLDWSARGVPEPAGLRFDLRMPACPAAVLELELPADREPQASRDVGLLTGPLPGRAADRRTWRLAFAGAAQVGLTVRRIVGGPPPLVLVKQRTRQEVSPGRTDCEFTFDLEVPNDGVRDLVVQCDPVLRPTEVTAPNLEHWQARGATDEDESTRVEIHLREPMRTGSVTLRAVGPATPDRPWASPAAAVVGAIPRGDQLTIRVHPDLHLSDWRPGSFRLLESSTATDRWQVLKLQEGLIRKGEGRPAAWLRPAGPDFQVRERLWWLVTTDRMTLTAQMTIEVSRGPVFQVPLELPAGWKVERVETDPPDLLGAATPDGSRLLVNLQKALGTGGAGRLTVELVRRTPRSESAEAVPLPDIISLGAQGRQGTLACRIGPGLQSATTEATAADVKPAGDGAPAPWGDAAADYIFPIRSVPLFGAVRIRPQATRANAHAVTAVTLNAGQAELTCRLRLAPVTGSPDAVVVCIPGESKPWDWQVVQGGNDVRSVQRLDEPSALALAALAAGTPWSALTAAGVGPGSPVSWWRIALVRPMTEPIVLEAHAAVPSGNIPLIRVPATSAEDHRVTLDLRSVRGLQPISHGLTDLPLAGGSPRFRAYRYGNDPAALTLTPSDNGERAAFIDAGRLVTFATEPSRLVHCLNFRVWNWDRPTVPVDLPLDAVLRQVRVNGVVAGPASAAMERTAYHVEAPAPIGTQSLVVEVVYSTRGVPNGLLTLLDSPDPGLPLGGAVRRTWCLPSDCEPLPADNWRESYAVAVAPGLIPSDITRGRFWEPQDAIGGSTIRLVRPREVGLIGGFMAILGLALAWLGRSWSAYRWWAVLLIWIGMTAACVVWLPAPLAAAARWPLLAGLVAAGWQLLPTRPAVDPPTVAAPRSSSLARGFTAVLLATTWLGGAGSASVPAPVTVYLIPPPVGAAGPTTILVPPELLDRLNAQVRLGPAGLDGCAWTEVRYKGRMVGNDARFTAVLRLHSFAVDPPPLALPLTGIRLGEARLDGAPAFLRAEGDHYLVTVNGRGAHTLEVTFAISCSSSEADRDLRFGVPAIANSRLWFAAPAGATLLQAMSRRGSEQFDSDAEQPHLEAELGRAGEIRLRWRMAGPAAPKALVQTQETYLWDLTDSAARLLGAVRYAIGPGSVTALTVALPNGLEVSGVAARPLDSQPGGWLRSWHINPSAKAGGRRSLILEFAAPIEGRWQVNLELVPRGRFAASFALPFPSAGGTASSPPVFAWRQTQTELRNQSDITEIPPNGATPLTPESFARDHWVATKIEADPRLPNRSYQRKVAGTIPALRFKAAGGTHERATADIEWHIGLRRAEFEVTGHVNDPAGPVSFVEWIVPASVAVAQVSGPDIHAWSRTGTRLQVWLTHPVAEAVMHIAGSVPGPAEARPFEVPPIRPSGIVEGTLRVACFQGSTATPTAKTNLTEAGPENLSGREWNYAIHEQPYRLVLDVRPTVLTDRSAPPTVQVEKRHPVPKGGSAVRVELTDARLAPGDDGRWTGQTSFWLTQSGDADLRVTWPERVRLYAVELDGKALPAPELPTETVQVPSSPGGHRLQIVWAAASADRPPTKPEIPVLSAGGEPVPAGPMVWTVQTPVGRNPAPDAAPLPAGAAALYRAAAQIRLAGLVSGDASNAARARAAIELRRADAAIANSGDVAGGPGGITLNAWRQQLREALSPGAATTVREKAESLPYDGAFARGTPVSWYVPAGEDGPRLTWPETRPQWPIRLVQTVAIAFAGFLGVWWGRRLGTRAWPEQVMLLGCAAWAADCGLVWLVPVTVGILARMTLLVGAAVRRWRLAQAHADRVIA